MREIRKSGSEGGGATQALPTPIRKRSLMRQGQIVSAVASIDPAHPQAGRAPRS